MPLKVLRFLATTFAKAQLLLSRHTASTVIKTFTQTQTPSIRIVGSTNQIQNSSDG